MGSLRLGVPETLALALRDSLNIRVFIETGLYKGGTASWAAQHFERVFSIEGYEPRWQKTTAALAGKYPNLSMHFGDSRTELGRVLAEIKEGALFWLDAHWIGDASHAHSIGDECPLSEELAIILKHSQAKYHCILIDDARLFLAPPPYPHDPAQWPTFSAIERTLAGYCVTVHEDVIVAVPEKAQSIVEQWRTS